MILFLKSKYSSFVLSFIFHYHKIQPSVEAIKLKLHHTPYREMNKKAQQKPPCYFIQIKCNYLGVNNERTLEYLIQVRSCFSYTVISRSIFSLEITRSVILLFFVIFKVRCPYCLSLPLDPKSSFSLFEQLIHLPSSLVYSTNLTSIKQALFLFSQHFLSW